MRRIIKDAAKWAAENGLKGIIEVGKPMMEEWAIAVGVREVTFQERSAKCTYTKEGKRSMYELDRH